MSLLSVENLKISFGKKEVIKTISFEIFENEILGIVGESGSGKSVTSLALMGLLPKNLAKITSGNIIYKSHDITNLRGKAFQKIKGKQIAMIFQEPMSSLNPSMRCGKQVEEILKQHSNLNDSELKAEVLQLFEQVKLPNPERVYKAYPHEISGGQKQRVMIAMAISCKPDLLIADEPTTALDVTVQKEIIILLKELQKQTKMSVLFITHDLALISKIADRVLVMYKGEIVEQNTTEQIFNSPINEYTKALIASRPSLDVRLKRLPTVSSILKKEEFANEYTAEDRLQHHKQIYSQIPLLQVIDVDKEYISTTGFFGKKERFKAVNHVSFNVYEGETLGLVGESGCGKSTLGNAILNLEKATAGKILYRGIDITKISKAEMVALRKEIQIIFQDPYSSLNPRRSVGETIMEPMLVHKLYASKAECKAKTLELLTQVGLDGTAFNRYPHEFSGGQRQRVGIARTIALQPKLIVCDESVSALDISVQAQVLNLLNELKENFGFTYIFISHDLAVVKYMSDQLLVMNKGQIEEIGDADQIYSNPKKPYTKTLIEAIPKGI